MYRKLLYVEMYVQSTCQLLSSTYALYRQSILEEMVPLLKHMSRLEKNIAGLNEIGFDDVQLGLSRQDTEKYRAVFRMVMEILIP